MTTRILQGPKFRCPIEEKSLGHFFFNRCKTFSDRICQIDGTDNTSETYKTVKLRTVRVALELQKRNITSNDVIAVCATNTLNNAIPLIAAFYLGAKTSNLDPTFSIRHTKHLISITTPKIIFVEEASVKLVEDALQNETFHSEIVVFGSSDKHGVFSDFEKPKENEEDFVPVDVDPDDIAVISFSSGTTGLPKGICHSHRSCICVISQACQYEWGRRVLYFTTFYSMTTMVILGACSNFGSYRVFCRKYSGEEIFRIIKEHKVRCIFMAPILTYELTRCEKAKNYDTSSLEFLFCGGTPIAPSQFKDLGNLFPQTRVSQIYGMTEIGIIAGFEPETDNDLIKKKSSSCGKLGPGIQMKVVDLNTGEPLGPNEKGEICLFSPSLMKCYYQADSSHVFDKDGFLKTGDVGYYDEDNYVYVIERIKEMLKYRSRHIIPAALEAVLLEHPAIKEVVVFGIPHEEDGDLPAACIVLKEGCILKEEEIDDFLVERVADRERLRGGVVFVDAIPKTPSGKLARREMKEFTLSLRKNESGNLCVHILDYENA